MQVWGTSRPPGALITGRHGPPLAGHRIRCRSSSGAPRNPTSVVALTFDGLSTGPRDLPAYMPATEPRRCQRWGVTPAFRPVCVRERRRRRCDRSDARPSDPRFSSTTSKAKLTSMASRPRASETCGELTITEFLGRLFQNAKRTEGLRYSASHAS